MKRWIIRATWIIGALLASMVLLTWLLWIPTAQESPYRFVRTWGEPGKAAGQF